MASDLTLYYADVLVGTIKNPFRSDNTWYGIIELRLSEQDQELASQIDKYIRFVEDWNERLHRNEPADANEFGQYSNLVDSGLWFTQDQKGSVSRITEAPVFFVGGEVSWRTD